MWQFRDMKIIPTGEPIDPVSQSSPPRALMPSPVPMPGPVTPVAIDGYIGKGPNFTG